MSCSGSSSGGWPPPSSLLLLPLTADRRSTSASSRSPAARASWVRRSWRAFKRTALTRSRWSSGMVTTSGTPDLSEGASRCGSCRGAWLGPPAPLCTVAGSQLSSTSMMYCPVRPLLLGPSPVSCSVPAEMPASCCCCLDRLPASSKFMSTPQAVLQQPPAVAFNSAGKREYNYVCSLVAEEQSSVRGKARMCDSSTGQHIRWNLLVPVFLLHRVASCCLHVATPQR